MTIETKELVRTFRYNSVDLPDPGAQYTVEQVRDFYSATYPEITSAAVEGPEEKDGKLVYTFRRAVGTKGGDDRERGLYEKYRVERLNDPAGKHNNCRYFVLDLTHDKHAGPALQAYARSCLREYPALADDLLDLADQIHQRHGS